MRFCCLRPSKHVGPLTASKVVQEPTCTEPGYKIQCCALCGGEAGARTAIPATGHQPGQETVFQEATCLTASSKGVKCTVCGQVIRQTAIPMTGHTPGMWLDLRMATCTAEGTRVQRCAVCGETLKTETIPALGHSFTEWAAGGEGQQSRYCSACGYTEYRTAP